MLEQIKREVCELRQLVLTPTPHNFQIANSKLEALAAFLSRLAAAPDQTFLSKPDVRDFLRRVPAEMARIRRLMEAPSTFYQTLDNLRAVHFGAYERSGTMRSLETRTLARTVVHL
jgi:hypothetical protein